MPDLCRTLALAVALAAGALACSPPPAPGRISIRILPVSRPVLSTDEPYQLEAEVDGAADRRVVWSGEGLGATGRFESASPGTFALVARTGAEPSAIAAVSLQVVARPRLVAFTAEPPAITAGESARLQWAVEGAPTVLLDGERQTAQTSSVSPAATHTFELAAANRAGLTVTSRLTLSVVPAPVIETFVAEPAAVTAGQPSALRWSTLDATEVRLDGQPVTIASLALTPQATRDHLLEARNALGFLVSRTVHLEVAPPPQILAFTADAVHLTSGESTPVRWTTLDATELLLDGAPVSGSQAVLAPTSSGPHQLEARNRLGFAVLATVQLTVVPAPAIAAFEADAAILTAGQSTTLRWTTSAASELRVNGGVVTGSSVQVTPAATVDYVLEASNPAGFTVTRTVRVRVVAPPLIQTFVADRASLTAGESTTLRWTTTGATELRLDAALVTGTSQSISPSATTSFVLVASNAAGAAVTLTVAVGVVPAPIILTFTSDAASLTAGQSTTLRWTTTGVTELRLDGALVTGSSAAIAPAATGAYTLTVKNALGFTASQSLNVAVVPAAAIGSFSSARTSITQSESTLISWSVSNAASVRVNGAVVSGNSLSVSPAVTTSYLLEARNSLGAAVTASLTLTVVPRIVLDLAASPAAVEVGTPSTLSWTAAGAATLTLNGAPVTGTSLAVSPIRSTVYALKGTNSLGFETVQTLTLTVAPYPGTVWAAAGQVWLRWIDVGPITGTQTWDVYRSTSPITTLATATRVGRLLPEDLHAARLKLADPSATWTLPLATGATTALAANEAHFTWTPRAAETSFFAVVPTGSSTPQVRFGPIDEALAPVTAHAQGSGVDAASGLAYSDYAIWLDGRAGADPGRADFPVMGPASFNGLAAIFRVYASVTGGGAMPGLLVLHGSGGNWLDHPPASSSDGPDVRLSKGIVAALDDAFAYASGSTVSIGTTRWFGSWDGYDRFSSTLTLPPAGAIVHPYSLRRLLWIRDWLIATRGVDPDRVLIAGHSMGALGALTATRAFPDRFAGTLAYQGHTHVVAGFGDYLRGTEAQNLTTSLNGRSIGEIHDPAVTLAPGDLPPIHLVWGSTDNMIPWADKPATIAQLSALKRGHQIWWDQRTHGYPWTGRFVGSVGLRAESLVSLRRNQSYPAFSAEVSSDANTGNPWGTQGGYLEWDPASISDTASQWSADLWLRGSAALAADLPTFATVTVDVSLRRPQAFFPPAGSTRSWTVRRISDNAVLQSGTLTVSGAGLVTASAVVIPKDPQRVRLSIGP